MEQRFGYDFSRVRVHSGAAAEQSAQDVNANAYTVGHDVVFGAALFAPGTHAGQRLLAHELTHVVQQGRVGPSIQRAHPGGTGKSARCDYEEGEVAKSHTLKGIVELDVAFAAHYGIRDPVDADAVLISDFGVGDDALKPSTAAELHTSGWIANWDKPTGSPLEVLGYTDCSGGEYDNALLRFKRGQNVAALFPQARPNMKSAGAARMGEFLADNSSARGRALNRSVILRKLKPAPTPVPTPAPTPTPAPEQYVTIKRREPSTEECDKDQRFRLSVAFPAARMMAQYAIEVISGMHKGSEEEAVLIKYFGKDSYAHRWHIKQGYVDTLRAWKRDTTFQCHQQKTGRCVENPNKVTLGYVIKAAKLFGGNIHICERAFKLKDVDLAEVVLHEASHLLDWTTDRQYCNLKTGARWARVMRRITPIPTPDLHTTCLIGGTSAGWRLLPLQSVGWI